MKKSILIIGIIVVVVAIILVIRNQANSNTPSPKTALAQCLTEKGAKFYGAYWCPHCNNQKLAFGSRAAKKLPYTECALFPTEVSSVKSKVLKEYTAGTYTGAYKEQLDAISKSIADYNELQKAGPVKPEDTPEITSIDKWEPSQTEACVAAKIEGYPTWIFPDNTRQSGEVALDKLAELSGCEYVAE